VTKKAKYCQNVNKKNEFCARFIQKIRNLLHLHLRNILFLLFLVGFTLLLKACASDQRRDIRDYYFPVEALRSGRVYEYVGSGNSDNPASEYWYYKSFKRDSAWFLAATYYDQNFQIGQIVREKIDESGASAKEYFLYEPDTITQQQAPVPVTIESPLIYPFQVRDSAGTLLFRLSYHPIWEPEATVTLVRNRRFLGDGPAFKFRGKSYPSIRFDVRETVVNDRSDAEVVEGIGEEWYAKGIGLVYSRKTYGAGELTIENRLNDIFMMAELEKRAKAVYGE
jgi:hypothetical protein